VDKAVGLWLMLSFIDNNDSEKLLKEVSDEVTRYIKVRLENI